MRFRFFRIIDPTDRLDALFIYEGEHNCKLFHTLTASDDNDGTDFDKAVGKLKILPRHIINLTPCVKVRI